MRSVRRLFRVLAICAGVFATSSVSAAMTPDELPGALRDWVAWVHHDEADPACALINDADDGERICAWPGLLTLAVTDTGARFTITWTVYARSAIPLPGDGEHWPQDVVADGRALAVVADENDTPVTWLEPGRHALSGTFTWAERPEMLPLPNAIALVDLSIDGAPVFPLQRDDAHVWLGAPAGDAREADSLDLQVFRHIADGVPARLTTVLLLDVSGAGREENLGRPLPTGWLPIALDGEIPARIDADGTLRVQARPGEHRVTLVARATAPLVTIARGDAGSDKWPTQEVWSYAANPQLRVTEAEGASAIDPSQAGVPSEWSALPAFLIEGESALKIVERSRGLSDQDQNRLTLQRRLWLDFDGDGWTAKDQLTGTMVRDWRLDVATPYALTRAETNGEGLLVTKGPTPERTGVEVRERNVNVAAGLRIDDVGGKLPVTGWQQAFEYVGIALQLPPGYRLYAALGVDDAPQAWVSRWQLLDVFAVAFTSLLAFWLLRWPLALLVAGYLVLGYHEPGAPVWTLLVLLVMSLFVRALPDGRFAFVMGIGRWLAFALVAMVLLPFAYGQVRLALYPQLERDAFEEATYAQYQNNVLADSPAPAMAPPPPPPPPAPVPDIANAEERVLVVQGSRVQRADLETSQPIFRVKGGNAVRQRYANNASIQAGSGEPNWSWRGYDLSWSGPVLATQEMRLVISPPWLTRVTRLVVLLLLAGALAMIVRARLRPPPGSRADDDAARTSPPRGGVAATALIAGLVAVGAAHAQAPSDEILAELRERTAIAPECAPTCGHIARARIIAAGDDVRVALELHAAERVALPLPFDEALLSVRALTVDGVAGAGVLRRGDGEAWIVVERGVHRAEMTLRAADADKIALRFPLAPSDVQVQGTGWEANGVRDGALLTDTLELVRVRDASQGSGTAAAAAQQFPPYVRVERFIDLDLDWSVATDVQRIAPDEAGFSVDVPLIAGERVMTPGMKQRGGSLTVPVQAGEASTSWESQLARNDTLVLTAPELADHAEVWRIKVSPTWNLRHAGVPVVYPPNDGEAEWIHEFHPLPGETLTLTVVRPDAVVGNTVAIDGVRLRSDAGQRAIEHTLGMTLRSTQGGQHVVTIPPDGELLSLTLGGQPLNVRPDDGKIGLPLHPGAQEVVIRWRDAQGVSFATRSPVVHVGAPASNLDTTIQLPANRWLLATSGPRIGPAVLYWGELLAMIAVAFVLARFNRTPLRFHQWLLLGLGFSTFSWPALVLFAGWLFLLDARCRWADTQRHVAFVLGQIALAMLSVIAIVVLLGALWRGLMGEPDMHVVGNGSTAHALKWFADQTDDALPAAAAFSVSLWWYKAAMLAWALWLASALGSWLRWGWSCFGRGGYWRDLRPAGREPPPPTPVVVATPPAHAPPPAGDG